jgi:peptide methionine sulfoxide reductase msrA/msrB
VRVTFDPERLDYETLAKAFFEIHDPTQSNRQGPDIGTQYRSAVFVSDSEQESVIAKLIGILRGKGFAVVTQVEPAGVFWPAEDYHQDYYQRSGKAPYCHEYTRRF